MIDPLCRNAQFKRLTRYTHVRRAVPPDELPFIGELVYYILLKHNWLKRFSRRIMQLRSIKRQRPEKTRLNYWRLSRRHDIRMANQTCYSRVRQLWIPRTQLTSKFKELIIKPKLYHAARRDSESPRLRNRLMKVCKMEDMKYT